MPKLAEALVQRKGLQEQLQRLCSRLTASAKVQEGEHPDEQPDGLLDEVRGILAEIKRLTIEINKTNMASTLPNDSLTLMEAIAERDRLAQERNLLVQFSNAARVEPTRGYGVTRNEVKWKSTVNLSELQKEIDAAFQSYRLLDTRIQEANWLTDLIQN